MEALLGCPSSPFGDEGWELRDPEGTPHPLPHGWGVWAGRAAALLAQVAKVCAHRARAQPLQLVHLASPASLKAENFS